MRSVRSSSFSRCSPRSVSACRVLLSSAARDPDCAFVASSFAPGICLAIDLGAFPLLCSPTEPRVERKRKREHQQEARQAVTSNVHSSSRSRLLGAPLNRPLKKPRLGCSGISMLGMKRQPLCSGSSSGRAQVTAYLGPSDDASSPASLLWESGCKRRGGGKERKSRAT